MVEFIVYGHPATAGSKDSFPIRRDGRLTGRTVVVDSDRRAQPWKAHVALAAVNTGTPCLCGALRLDLAFYFHRPRAHYRTGRNAHLLRDAAPAEHITRPDVLKLARAVEDALTGVLWRDDAQVCQEVLSKHYAEPDEPERVVVSVEQLEVVPVPIPGQLEIA